MEAKFTFYSKYELIVGKLKGNLTKQKAYSYLVKLMRKHKKFASKKAILDLRNCNFKFTDTELDELSQKNSTCMLEKDRTVNLCLTHNPFQTACIILVNNILTEYNISFDVCSSFEKPLSMFSLPINSHELEKMIDVL